MQAVHKVAVKVRIPSQEPEVGVGSPSIGLSALDNVVNPKNVITKIFFIGFGFYRTLAIKVENMFEETMRCWYRFFVCAFNILATFTKS